MIQTDIGPALTELLASWDGAKGSQGPTLKGAAGQVREASAKDLAEERVKVSAESTQDERPASTPFAAERADYQPPHDAQQG